MSFSKELIEVTRPYWPLVLGLFVYPMTAAWLNWVLWFDTPEKWDAFALANPRGAFAIKLFRLANPHLRPVLLAWRSMANARSALPPQPPQPPPSVTSNDEPPR